MMNPEDRALLFTIRDELRINTTKTEELLNAFPSGDIDGHRRYHQSVIEWRELRNKMVREAFINMAKVGSLAAAGILIAVAWKALKISITQG
jgi:hypothetical protein